MTPDTWNRLDEIFVRAPVLRAGPADPALVDAAALELGAVFPQAYREFVVRHGGAIVGAYSICGVRCAQAMGHNETVVEVTKLFRDRRWPGTERWVVFSMDHGGNPVGFDTAGVVWTSDHDFGGIQRIADDFESCVRRWCLRLPE